MVDEIYDVIDRRGRKLKTATWTEVHTQGLLHTTASILIFRDQSQAETLIHRRSDKAVQDTGLWQHAAGGHVLAGDTPDEGVRKELQEELFENHELPELDIVKISSFYNHDMPNNYEILHIYQTIYPGPFYFDKKEVAEEPVWIKWGDLMKDMQDSPKKYAQVFHNIIKEYIAATKSIGV